MENCSDDYPVSPSPDTALTGQERGKGEKAGRRGGGDRGRGDRREGEKKVVGNEKLTDAKVKVLTSLIWTLIKRNSFNVDNWIKGRDETLAVVIGINLPGKHKKKGGTENKMKRKKRKFIEHIEVMERRDETITVLIWTCFFYFVEFCWLEFCFCCSFGGGMNIKPWTESRMWSIGGCCCGADCLPERVPWGSVGSSGTWPATIRGRGDPGSSRRIPPRCNSPNRRSASI